MSTFTALQRLDFQLPDFTRVTWTSDDARAVWQPRIRRINSAWAQIEWCAIEHGVRRCALNVVPAGELVGRASEWALAGLNGLPLELQGMGNFGYLSARPAPVLGMPFGYRVVVGSPGDVAEFKRAYDGADSVSVGRLLGYPECCRKFFERTWVDAGLIDTTWAMAAATAGASGDATACEVAGPFEANILGRWLSVRAVPHLPCTFHCEATVEFGRRLMAVGRELGYGQEVDWIEEILSWPAEWSALHGIAEIKMPVLKISTRTDATAAKYTVRRRGERYPPEGARALGFPFNTPKRRLFTGSPRFRLGLQNPIGEAPRRPDWYASDNGFKSVIAMDRAHGPIVDLAAKTMKKESGNVLDLGCGNGALLRRVHARLPEIVPHGIEIDAERLRHAALMLPESADRLYGGDLLISDEPWQNGRRYALVLLMPGRLVEADEASRSRLLQRLAERCDRVLVYAYGDWLTRFETLRGLTAAAGLELREGAAEDAVADFARVAAGCGEGIHAEH